MNTPEQNNVGVKNYTLECGCFFESTKKAGVDVSYELTSSCAFHGGKEQPLSSGPPLNNFMWAKLCPECNQAPPHCAHMQPHAVSNQERDSFWRTRIREALVYVLGEEASNVETPTAGPAEFAMRSMFYTVFNMGKAKLTQCVKPRSGNVPARRVDDFYDDTIDPFRTRVELEQTQPIHPGEVRSMSISIQTGTSPLYMHVRSADGFEYVCVDCGVTKGNGHHKFCKFHAPALE